MNSLVAVLSLNIIGVFVRNVSPLWLSLIGALAMLPFVSMLLAARAKRCHDLNHPMWFQLIPFFGIWMLFVRGSSGENRFGVSPKVFYQQAQSSQQLGVQRESAVAKISIVLLAWVPIAVILLCFEAFRIPTGSMERTLLPGDFILVNKAAYGLFGSAHAAGRGDVVVFEYPGDRDEVHPAASINYNKRCAGIPGDTIALVNKTLFVNGVESVPPPGLKYMHAAPVPPDKIDPKIFPAGAPWNLDNYGPLRVPQRGDVIALTEQSYRTWKIFIEREGHKMELVSGAISIDDKPATSYTVERNYYFMMGDNRDDSADSRIWGFVPEENIIGKIWLVYFSFDYNNSSIRWNRIFRSIN